MLPWYKAFGWKWSLKDIYEKEKGKSIALVASLFMPTKQVLHKLLTNESVYKHKELSSVWRPEGGTISTLIEACQPRRGARRRFCSQEKTCPVLSAYRRSDRPVTVLPFLVDPRYVAMKVTPWLYAAFAVPYIWVTVLMLDCIVLFFPSFLGLRLVISVFFSQRKIINIVFHC